jgi:hypothetical protein
MRLPLFLILAIMLLVGCTESKTILVKEGISEQEMQSDMAECHKDPTAIGYVERSNEDFARCIMAKGYREATEKETKRWMHTDDPLHP